MPLKHAVRELVVDECADSTLAGAVNTIVRGTSGWHGFNTDVWGAQTAIAQSIGTHSRSAIVLGGGATASSLTVALARIGVEHVTVALRDVSKAGALRSLAVRLGLGIDVVQLNGASLKAELLVNTLPGNVQLDASAIDDLDAGALFDVSYDPWPNALSREWTARGLPSSSGLLMLLWQAVRQARVFYGDGIDEPLPNEGVVITAMRSAVGL
jgi:shikimate dehydrogenase